MLTGDSVWLEHHPRPAPMTICHAHLPPGGRRRALPEYRLRRRVRSQGGCVVRVRRLRLGLRPRPGRLRRRRPRSGRLLRPEFPSRLGRGHGNRSGRCARSRQSDRKEKAVALLLPSFRWPTAAVQAPSPPRAASKHSIGSLPISGSHTISHLSRYLRGRSYRHTNPRSKQARKQAS